MIETILPVLISVATTYNLDTNLVQAIAEHESLGNQWAARYEPGWKYFYFPREYAENLKITPETEEILQSVSWGPLQIMGSVARELGFKEYLTELTDLKTGLEYGCKKIRRLSDKYPDEMDVISAYNAGYPRKTPGGQYLNMLYVDAVWKRLEELRTLK